MTSSLGETISAGPEVSCVPLGPLGPLGPVGRFLPMDSCLDGSSVSSHGFSSGCFFDGWEMELMCHQVFLVLMGKGGGVDVSV